MAAISQTTFSNAFYCMINYVLWFQIDLNLLVRVDLKKKHNKNISSAKGEVLSRRQAIIWTNDELVY